MTAIAPTVGLLLPSCGIGVDTLVQLRLNMPHVLFILPAHVAATIQPILTGAASASFSISPNLPPGLTLDPATGMISGTPSVAQAIPPPPTSYQLFATDPQGHQATASFAIQIQPTWQVTTLKTGLSTPVDIAAVPPVPGAVSDLYIANQGDNTIRLLTSNGNLTLFAGGGGTGGVGGIPGSATMNKPAGIFRSAFTGDFVEFDFSNALFRQIAYGGATPGAITNATMTGGSILIVAPSKTNCDNSGNVYYVDTGAHLIGVIPPSGGSYTAALFAGTASTPGPAPGAPGTGQLRDPQGLALDNLSSPTTVYIADSGNHAIRTADIATGTLANFAGTPGTLNSGFADGQGSAAKFNNPVGLAVDPSGAIFVADFGNQAIRMITPSGAVTTIAGAPPPTPVSGSLDGAGNGAQFANPSSVTIDPTTGALYIADTGNNSIRKIVP